MTNSPDRLLQRLAWITLILLYATVLAGSVVRATGSGMGCPDWPFCFGRLIPPTDVSQLPPDYKILFKKPNHEIADFNVVHTWVEYLNRLLGAAGGLTMLGIALLSFRRRSVDTVLPRILFGALLLFGLVSWLGSVVVATNLKPKTITLHSLAAIVLVCATIIAIRRVQFRVAGQIAPTVGAGTRYLLIASLVMTGGQIILGTQVREEIDQISAALNDCCRDQWIGQLGWVFVVHKFSAWALVVVTVVTYIALRPYKIPLTWTLPVLLAAEYAVGVFLTRFAVPAVLQPVHLFLATLLIGVIVALLSGTRRSAGSPLQPTPPGGML